MNDKEDVRGWVHDLIARAVDAETGLELEGSTGDTFTRLQLEQAKEEERTLTEEFDEMFDRLFAEPAQ